MAAESAHKPKKADQPERPSVFCFHDYRDFLKEWTAYLKATTPRFSLRKLSAQAEMSPGYLPLVLSGAINLSMNAAVKLTPFLQLTQSERHYFENLVKLCVSDSPDARAEALSRMGKFASYRKNNPNEAQFFGYMSRWSHIAIREMAHLPDFKADAKWIRTRLRTKIPLADIEAALDFLTKNGYLEVRPDGTVVPPQEFIKCAGGVYRATLVHYHKEMFSLAASSIENATADERCLVGQTIAIDSKHFDAAQALLREALEKVRSLSDTGTTDSVYHVGFSLFPLTKKGQAV